MDTLEGFTCFTHRECRLVTMIQIRDKRLSSIRAALGCDAEADLVAEVRSLVSEYRRVMEEDESHVQEWRDMVDRVRAVVGHRADKDGRLMPVFEVVRELKEAAREYLLEVPIPTERFCCTDGKCYNCKVDRDAYARLVAALVLGESDEEKREEKREEEHR